MIEQNIKVKVNVENNIVVDKTEEKKLCKILVAKGDKGQDGTVSFDELTEEQKASLKGEDGKGVPEGGKAGQILAKTSDDDFDAEWIDNNAEIDLTDYAKKDEIPTKTSELENDSNFLVMNDDYNHLTGRLHVSNNFDDYQERKVDISAQYLMGAENGGLPSTLYINAKCDTDVRILENGTGTLYYKDKEVATQEYVDEQIENIEISSGVDLSEYATKEELTEYAKTTDLHKHDNKAILDSISQEDIDNWNNNTGGSDYELPIASAGVLGGIKVGANLSIDADGTLNAVGGGISEIPIASATTLGGVKIGDNLSIDENGVLSANSSGSSLDIFSTEEQVIGTWIDGLPIYRKVIVTTTPSTANSWADVHIGVDNIKEYIRYSARFEHAGLTYFADVFEDSTHKFMAVAKTNAIAMFVGHSEWCSKPMTLILEYTKTTD